jgi:hypothetical protein
LNKLSKKSDSTESEASFQSSTSLTSKDVVVTQSKEVKILQKLLKIVKYLSVKIEKDKIRITKQKILNIEWKELARRIDYFLLFLYLFVIVLIPILLFGKFFYRDFITNEHLKSPCGCQHSFVR